MISKIDTTELNKLKEEYDKLSENYQNVLRENSRLKKQREEFEEELEALKKKLREANEGLRKRKLMAKSEAKPPMTPKVQEDESEKYSLTVLICVALLFFVLGRIL